MTAVMDAGNTPALYSRVVQSKPVDMQDFLLVYNEELDYGNTPPIDRQFFNTVDGLDACKHASNWPVESFKRLITGLQPMGKHCFTVQCRGANEMKTFYDKIPSVLLFGNRLFIGATAESCGMKLDPNLIRIKIEGLLAAIPDSSVREKLEKYGVVEKMKTERERVRNGIWKNFETGTRYFFMKFINNELGLPPVFYIKNERVRVFHQGQVRGKERDREERKRRGESDIELEMTRRQDEMKKYRETRERNGWQNITLDTSSRLTGREVG